MKPTLVDHCGFVSGASYGQRVTVRTWVEENRSRGITFNYEVLKSDSNDMLVKGFTKHIWTDNRARSLKHLKCGKNC